MSQVRGWVYVITNEAMPNLVKVGFSMKEPTLRAKELDGPWAPKPHVVAYDALVFEPRRVEQAAHALLEEFNHGKEWFKCSTRVAVSAIKKAAGDALVLDSQVEVESSMVDGGGPWPSAIPVHVEAEEPPINSARHCIVATGTYEGTCGRCGDVFTATLHRSDQTVRCPTCLEANSTEHFKRREFVI